MTNEKDSEQQGQMVTVAFSVTERETGKEIILRPNSSRTVQSIALMRLGLFVPSPKALAVRVVNTKLLALMPRKNYRHFL